MDALSSYSGVSTAGVLTPSAMPSSILADTMTPPNVPQSPYTIESLSPQLSSLLTSYTFPSVLSYTLSGYSPTVPATRASPTPSAASFYNSDGSIGVTNLPSSRLATLANPTGSGTAMATMGPSNSTAGGSQPDDYNPNAACSHVPKSSLLVLTLIVTTVML